MNANYIFLTASEAKIVELQRSGSSKETEKDTQRERPDFYPSTNSTMLPLPSRRAKQEANQLKI
jgi:hypothetical protein